MVISTRLIEDIWASAWHCYNYSLHVCTLHHIRLRFDHFSPSPIWHVCPSLAGWQVSQRKLFVGPVARTPLPPALLGGRKCSLPAIRSSVLSHLRESEVPKRLDPSSMCQLLPPGLVCVINTCGHFCVLTCITANESRIRQKGTNADQGCYIRQHWRCP